MYTVYVLYSESHKKIYVGYTSDINNRFLSHNRLAKKGWTVPFRPWRILHTEKYESKSEAMQREKVLKGAKGREWIWNMINEI